MGLIIIIIIITITILAHQHKATGVNIEKCQWLQRRFIR